MTRLTPEELERRREATDFAQVSCEMEGLFITDPKYIALREQYRNGEIGLNVIGAYVDSLLEIAIKERKQAL